ncbi:DNA-methyltransferase [Mycoplasma hafezii]|uniref:DNA-methyltransferase n=1 Tax=Mycoplasma hafezii TaxID=525886 RepID=UPI003CEEF3F4
MNETKEIYDVAKIKNTIIQGDSLEVLSKIPDQQIDFIFADPPYFMQTHGELKRFSGETFNGAHDEWDKFDDFAHYDEFSIKWLSECKRILKDTGTIMVMGSFQNIYRLGFHMQNLGFWILNDIIWHKKNPVPNFAGKRFCNAHETILWCSKSPKAKFTFNYKTMKFLNNNKQEKSVWELPICSGKERLKDENGEKLHSTQKPEALLYKAILSTTKPNDIVLDPFFGTGTTGVVAKKLGRDYIGIERDLKYIKYSERRLEQSFGSESLINNLALEIKPPRISISTLIQEGYLNVGETLFNKKLEPICTILENGKVTDGEEILSIHKMGAKYDGKINLNGWNYFYKQDKDKIILIDELRYQCQSKMSTKKSSVN